MSNMPVPPHPKVLLVEGHDDRKVVEHLLGWSSNTARPFEIVTKGSFEGVRDSISNEIKVSGRKILGILVDANDSAASRWKSISGQLKRAKCETSKIESAGSIFVGPQNIRIGVWLMPDNQNSGELEDFDYSMIPENDPILPCAKHYIDSIPKKHRKFTNKKLVRAYLHAWLATCKKPRPMGLAITANDLNGNAAGAGQFVDWLRQLFEIE